MTLPSLSAPVPTSVARALVFTGNLLHSIGASLLSASNDELTDELAKTRAELDRARAERDELEHQGAAATLAGTAAAVAVVDELERKGAVIVVDELGHQGAELVDDPDASRLQPARRVDDDAPEWLGFGGFPANQSGRRL